MLSFEEASSSRRLRRGNDRNINSITVICFFFYSRPVWPTFTLLKLVRPPKIAGRDSPRASATKSSCTSVSSLACRAFDRRSVQNAHIIEHNANRSLREDRLRMPWTRRCGAAMWWRRGSSESARGSRDADGWEELKRNETKRKEGRGAWMKERAARPEKLNRKDHQVESGVGKICQAPSSVEREHERERVSFPFFFPRFVVFVSLRIYRPVRRRILSIVCQSETGTRPETELPRARVCKLQQEGTIARPCVKNEDIQMEIWFYINHLVEAAAAAAASFYLTEANSSLSCLIFRSLLASNSISPFIERVPSCFSRRDSSVRFRVPSISSLAMPSPLCTFFFTLFFSLLKASWPARSSRWQKDSFVLSRRFQLIFIVYLPGQVPPLRVEVKHPEMKQR